VEHTTTIATGGVRASRRSAYCIQLPGDRNTEDAWSRRAARRRIPGELARRVLVADGAMGTMLYAKGIFINRCYDEPELSAPAVVREVHEEYVKAGAEIVETTPSGQPHTAGRSATGEAAAINEAGCGWRGRRPGTGFVRGRWAAGVRIERWGRLVREARAAFRSRRRRWWRGGGPAVLETFANLHELRERCWRAGGGWGGDGDRGAGDIDDFGTMRTQETEGVHRCGQWPWTCGPELLAGRGDVETIERMAEQRASH